MQPPGDLHRAATAHPPAAEETLTPPQVEAIR